MSYTLLLFTAYAIVRTVPSANRPNRRKKKDGHVLTVSIALLLAILTGRSDLCIAGVFGAGKTRSLAVLLIALSCELKDFVAIVYTKENVAAKALADQLSDLAPPTIRSFGRLIGRMEEGKGEALRSLFKQAVGFSVEDAEM